MSTPADTYTRLLDETTAQHRATKKKLALLAWSRFAVFIGICLCLWPVFKYTQYLFFVPAGILTLVFLILVRQQVSVEKKARFLQVLIEVLQAETKALADDFSAFDAGDRFIDFDHAYSFDLDVFGGRSLYQQMNRTSSENGSRQLARWLQNPLLSKADIKARQEAARELAQKTSFRLHFLSLGRLRPFSPADQEALAGWMRSPENKPAFNPVTHVLLWLLTATNIVLWGLWVAGYLHYTIPSFVSSINLAWVYSQTGAINQTHRLLGNRYRLVKNLAAQVRLIEQESFQAASLRELQAKLGRQGTGAGKAIERLGSIMQNFDTRLNIFGAFLFNALFLFDLHVSRSLQRWKKQFGPAAAQWLEVVSETEAYNSLGTYVFNHPGFIFPAVDEAPLLLETTEMGHPLMRAAQRVNNSFALSGHGKFVIVTGSNMSGKSTFLRTAGLNMVLAQMGSPVCAQTFRFSPVDIFTSMRINDSLQQNESYFYAEIKRLNKITTEAALQKPVLILLDEILRGTNSTDKHTGSQALMLKLTELNATGILATHDLSLGELAEKYPGRFVNKCFESVIENNELFFDYKMRDGVCKNLNAVFLMKKMGIMS